MHIEKEGGSHFGLVFWWKDGDEQCRWEGKKNKGMAKYSSKNICTHKKWYTSIILFCCFITYRMQLHAKRHHKSCFSAAVSDKNSESNYKGTTTHPMKMEVKIGHLLSAYFVFDSINRMLFNAAIFFAPILFFNRCFVIWSN